MRQPGDRIFIDPDQLPAPDTDASVANPPDQIDRPDGTVPQVPDGFTVDLWAGGLDQARWIEALPNGDILLSRANEGDVLLLQDTDDDGTMDNQVTLADGFLVPHAMEWRDGSLYLADAEYVWRMDYALGAEIAGTPVTLTAEGALGEASGHVARSLALSPDGEVIYVGIGSLTNASVEESPRATVQAFDIDGSDQRTVTTGMRNPAGLEFDPATGDLYAAVVERDGLGDELPPGFMTRVIDGGFYGWPYAYAGPHPQPDLGGQNPDMVAATITPDVLFRAHSTPIGIAFNDATQFPEDYRGDAFVTLRGSWNAAEPRGYMVARVDMENGQPVGDYTAFATGFWSSGTETAEVWGRPTGVAFGPDGSLFIGDDVGGNIWRVTRSLAGDDVLTGTADPDSLNGESGNDTLSGAGDPDTLSGGYGDDQVFGNGDADIIYGNMGGDSLHGGAASDWMFGGGGDDTLNGGADADVLAGGYGADRFAFDAGGGPDRVLDFSQGTDVLAIATATGSASFAQLTVYDGDDGRAIIEMADGSRIELDGLTAAQVTADDVVFF